MFFGPYVQRALCSQVLGSHVCEALCSQGPLCPGSRVVCSQRLEFPGPYVPKFWDPMCWCLPYPQQRDSSALMSSEWEGICPGASVGQWKEEVGQVNLARLQLRIHQIPAGRKPTLQEAGTTTMLDWWVTQSIHHPQQLNHWQMKRITLLWLQVEVFGSWCR